MKSWIAKANELLRTSLGPTKHELNELDWKTSLSSDRKRLTEHLSAFANLPGGGFLVFGIHADGSVEGIDEAALDQVATRLTNLGRDALIPPVALDHGVEIYEGVSLLFVHIPESPVKPVHVRGKGIERSFIRSGGTTRLASRQEIGNLMLHSRTPRWEELHSSLLLPDDQLVGLLRVEQILKMLDRPTPSARGELLAWMELEGFIDRDPRGGGFVTNLGAVSAAGKLADFPDLSRKAVRVIVYDGLNKAYTKQEQEGSKGYAISFQGLMGFVMALLPQSEVIESSLRVRRTLYPEIALREIIANALIHQDFSITGTGPLIEIYNDRIEISNPGGLLPSKQLDRLIGTQPESRNEQLARAFRRYKVCEERGSGLLKASLEAELYGLPPIKFEAGTNYFKVSLFSPRTFSQMSPRERLDACYQHAVLKHLSGSSMTNTSLRERLKMPETQRSMVSVLIQEALDAQRLNRKFAEYVPVWA